jgi:thiol-disulfide isomerase/thioredoxin
MFEIPLAKALLMNGRGQDALDVLQGYRKSAGPSNDYYVALGGAYQELKRDKDALDAYFEAAVSGNGAALERSKALFAKVNGSDKDFDSELAERKERQPFQPPPFRVPENWKGKTALAEVFTGSECAPCVAATHAFDALEKSYPAKYLAVLKYHLPIPLYDPMMNHATKRRQDYYGREIVTGTPTAIIDGVASPSVGGYRTATESSFGNAKKEIDASLGAAAEVTITASAALSGDVVRVDCEFSKAMEGAEYNVALVQAEEEFKGGNGIVQHNMVVRDFKTVAPSAKASVTFNIPESEKAADAFITEWGKTASERNKQLSKWPARHSKIDRKNLKAVVFVQDKKTKQVYNAFVADVAVKGKG